ncbi:hypothetical protein [Streptomyces sp. NPDC052015]|uniref:hypothetical protein n=1 Tax=Streptomyces sp. NPDC052015 TaxID=3154755 RepID=UPI0034214D6D
MAYVLLQLVGKPSLLPANDTYRYARASLELLGDSPEQAHRTALAAYCRDQANYEVRRIQLDPLALAQDKIPSVEQRAEACRTKWAQGLAPHHPRYERIFEVRPGFAVAAVPFVAALGADSGLLVTSVLFTVAGGLLAFALLRAAGVPAPFAAGGQAFYYACPIGWWGGFGLTEGPVLALAMGALLGAWWLLSRRLAAGTVLLSASLVTGTAVKYSGALLLAAALTAAAVVCLVLVRDTRHRGTVLLAALSGAVTAGIALLSAWYSLPGSGETLQDTFTQHYEYPDVATPWSLLAELNGHYWTQWSQEQARSPWLLAAITGGAWALFRHSRALGWIVVAAGATGVATEIAHPVAGQGDRLMVAVWIIAVIGLPLLLHQFAQSRVARVPTST